MIIESLVTELWDPTQKRRKVATPTWAQIEAAIRRLDGIQYRDVALMAGDGVGMLVTGGLAGRYTCQVALGGDFWYLTDPTRSEETVVALVEDEEAEFPESYTVDLDTVLRAAARYAETGECDPSLCWT